MKRSLLTRLRRNGSLFLISALLLFLGVPLYQTFVMGPQGFAQAVAETGTGRYTTYIAWIGTHTSLFLGYRLLLLIAFLLIFSLPFSLYRIIVAQELMLQQEQREQEEQDSNEEGLGEVAVENGPKEHETDAMPEYPWRGKGFAVLAVWLGMAGVAIYVLGLVISTIYFITLRGAITANVVNLVHVFTIITDTVGVGLIGLATLFFGAMIARTGKNLWPLSWVIFGYAALFVGALLCVSAVAVASTPGANQSSLTTIATFLLAAWSFWLGVLLIRLKAEA